MTSGENRIHGRWIEWFAWTAYRPALPSVTEPTAAAHPAGRSGGPSRQRSPPRTTTTSHRRVERGPDYRLASSQHGTSSCTWDEPSTSSLQSGSCGDEKGGPNRPTRRPSGNNAPRGGGGRTPQCLAPWRRGRAPWASCGPDVRRGGHPEIDADHGIIGR